MDRRRFLFGAMTLLSWLGIKRRQEPQPLIGAQLDVGDCKQLIVRNHTGHDIAAAYILNYSGASSPGSIEITLSLQ